MACEYPEDEITMMISDEFREELSGDKDNPFCDLIDGNSLNEKCATEDKIDGTEFINSLKSSEMDTNMLTKSICARFNEKNVPIIESIVNCIGKKHAIQLVQDTLELEEKGGMLTQEGTRRSIGGVFIRLVESRKYLSDLKKVQSKEEIRRVNRINTSAKKNKKRRLKMKALKERLKSENLKEMMEMMDI
ncbi:hypothetical protein LOD99_13773 [Oopsacas minuta]|uniref:Phosphorylated adapter RNA export protein n=1 Tax=Oopsacas minuta TaxID=111878 RepID=A0AAV7KIT1_9METZ|nr:hypothetical protein LOD99_13773 [Oopsacas minuta]